MVGDAGGVVVGNGQSAFLVDEVTDEGGVKNKRLRADFVACHSFGDGVDFGGGEGGGVDGNFGNQPIKKKVIW